MRSTFALVAVSISACGFAASFAFAQDSVKPTEDANRVAKVEISIDEKGGFATVQSNGQRFANFDFRSNRKPVIYPLYAPGQIAVTRNYPMKNTVAGEAHDHPHHKSVWLAHGDVNGYDFWSEKEEIVCDSVAVDGNSILANNRWVAAGKTLVNEKTVYRFSELERLRLIDIDTTLSVGDEFEEVVFGDTKEGFFAMRTHPNLRLTNDERQGVTSANGQAVNSQGDKGKALWGKSAAWVYYWGNIDEKTVGIGIIDHKDNLRHPTTWHAREYGLVAANPFGLHHFQKKEKGLGNHTINVNKPLRFRYRVVVSNGKLTPEDMDRLAKRFDSGQ